MASFDRQFRRRNGIVSPRPAPKDTPTPWTRLDRVFNAVMRPIDLGPVNWLRLKVWLWKHDRRPGPLEFASSLAVLFPALLPGWFGLIAMLPFLGAVKVLSGPVASSPVKSWLNVTQPEVGIVMGSNSDQGALLAAALSLAAGSQLYSAVFIPPGYIKCRQELNWPSTRGVRLIGSGMSDDFNNGPSAIQWDQDLGAGKWAIKCSYPLNFVYEICDLALIGPGGAPVAGSLPCAMSGFFTTGQGYMRRVRIRAFGVGVSLTNDHQEFISVDLRSNGIAVDFTENGGGGLGDLVFNRVFMTDQGRASMAVSSTNTIANAIFTQGHAGAAPFGVWRYASPGHSATGSGASNVLTAVDIVGYIPTTGLKVEGTNIPASTTISSVAGGQGNYSLTLNNTPTGTVTNVVVGRRGTAMIGCLFDNWSWEGCHHSVLYDDYGVQSANWGSFTNLTFTTADSSTFAWQTWQQQNVAASGSNASTTISGVAVTNFTPTKGMQVTGTNVGAGAVVQTVSGSSGSWTLTVDVANTGAVTQVTVRQPTNLSVYEIGTAVGWSFTNGTPCPGYVNHPAIRANSIKHVHFDDADGIRNNIFDNPTTVRPFVIRTAYNANGQEVEDLTFGGPKDTGGLRMAASVTDDALAVGELVEANGLAHVRKSLASRIPLGHVVGTWTQGEVAVFIVSCQSHAFSKAKNTSASTITNDTLIKPDAGGGIKAATSITDIPVTGRAAETITAGNTGQVWARY